MQLSKLRLMFGTVAVLGLVCIQPNNALAAGTASDPPPSSSTAADPLDSARALIKQERWVEAMADLKRVNRPQSADWNNLMGYVHRKGSTPDLAAAQRYYDEALRIEPKHIGALEYSGELYLMKGDLANAKARMTTLEAVCGNCEELQDLKSAITKYEAGGKK